MKIAHARVALAVTNALLTGCLVVLGWRTTCARLAPASERVPALDPVKLALARSAPADGAAVNAVIWELLEKPLPPVEKPAPPPPVEPGFDARLVSIYEHPGDPARNYCIVEPRGGPQVVLGVGESLLGFTCRGIDVKEDRARVTLVSASGKPCALEIRRGESP
jgi:hypothetical protein